MWAYGGRTRIALAQVPCALGDRVENLRRMREVVSAGDADLFVFPELFLTGYMVRDDVYRLAEGLDGRSVRMVQQLCGEHGANILFGMAAWDDEVPGVLRNSAVLVSPNELVQRYDKVNLASFGPFEESLYFGTGGSPALLDVEGRKIGAIICFDLFFPELSKAYTLAGAEAIVCIAASPITSREHFEKLIPARAVENTVYMVYVNQVGTQLNQVYFGGGEACGPRGGRLVKNKYLERDVSRFEMSLAEVRAARRGRPTVRDSL
jgi:predicted amidohydrolase